MRSVVLGLAVLNIWFYNKIKVEKRNLKLKVKSQLFIVHF